VTGRRSLTIILQPDGALTSRTLRVPIWMLRLGAVVGLFIGASVALGIAFYLPIFRAAARVPILENKVARLEADNARIRQLVAALDSAENRYTKIREMLGADIVPDPVALSGSLPVAPEVRARIPGVPARYETGESVPRHWPLEDPGYVTRGQVGTGTVDEQHPGLDVAVPIGTLVRASGGGTVLRAGTDPEYGTFVLLQHPEGYQSMYGHLDRPTVHAGGEVGAGEVIGLSGNSGRSSAPHLHFEIRLNGQSLDPMTLVKEGS
jgi:murein DD-endopeptidase MepM/ murein hydrolase activator NlpD